MISSADKTQLVKITNMFFLYRTRHKTTEEKEYNEMALSWLLTPTPAEHTRLQPRVQVSQIAMSPSMRSSARRRSPSPRAKVTWLHLLVKLMHPERWRSGLGGVGGFFTVDYLPQVFHDECVTRVRLHSPPPCEL